MPFNLHFTEVLRKYKWISDFLVVCSLPDRKLRAVACGQIWSGQTTQTSGETEEEPRGSPGQGTFIYLQQLILLKSMAGKQVTKV